ncbi:DUF6443 domain-containing protein [Polaribacter sp. Asnod6-C07]|uniref:DUF6443 domain-containing protein n=1 Tax=Polaribacter sp. Asnod6-C07 TaxID=3160582 RepID=UPI0038658715
MKKKKIFLFVVIINLFTINSIISQSKYGKVAISEVYFDSYMVEDQSYANHHAGEFIELYNSSTEDIDISGWKIEDNVGSFTIPNNTIISSGGFKVITYTATKSLFIQLFPEASGYEQDIILQSDFILNNNIEKIHLKNTNDELISDASYYPVGWKHRQNLEIDLDNLLNQHNFEPIYGYRRLDNKENLSHTGAIPASHKTGIRLASYDAFYKNGNNSLFQNGEAKPFDIHIYVPLLPKQDIPDLEDIPISLSDENYIHTTTYQVAKKENQLSNVSSADKIQNVTYFDGLGRPIQKIAIQQSTSRRDIITHIEYDDLGRQPKNYLPFSFRTNDGKFINNALTETNQFYDQPKYQNTTNPYSETFFDGSPLNLPVEVSAPGNDWKQGITNEHTIKNEYRLIENTDQVYNLQVSFNSNGTPSLVNKGYFEVEGQTQGVFKAPTLYKFITKNENWKASDVDDNTTHTFKDYRGRVILKRTFDNNNRHDTYYVYDVYGNLSYVIPPKVTIINVVNNSISTTELSELCYQYKYDTKNRLIEKKIPGKGWEYIVYDKLDRPVLTQDAKLDSQNRWLFTKYDMFGRVAYTGYTSNSFSRATMQVNIDNGNYALFENNNDSFSNSGTTVYYSKAVIPIQVDEVYTINYYDTYINLPSGLLNTITTTYGVTSTTNTKNLATVSKERVLDKNNWITTVTYYDEKARPIYIYSFNDYLNTIDIVESKLDDFTGRALETKTTHKKTGKLDVVTQNYFSYDHLGRMITQKQKINSQLEELIVKNKYDELGALEGKDVGNTEATPLQKVDYKYNVRGWLTDINDINTIGNDLFTFKVNYNNKDISTTTDYTSLYNGNISETIWRTKSDYKKRAYQYKYDNLSRIIGANYRENDNLLSGSGKFETSYDYDKNGNLNNLIRNGSTSSAIDDLSYEYSTSSNKLIALEDASNNYTEGVQSSFTNYTYDPHNGNLIKDTGKGITNIEYNFLNLPTRVHFGSSNRIEYLYTASGSKIEKKVLNGGSTTTNYANGYIYENNVLKHFSHPEGYIEVNGSSFTYIYQYTDHLGNIRLNYTNTGNKTVLNLQIKEENNYYPFGMKMLGFNTNIIGVKDNYKYNGKEYQDEEINGKKLDWYDYGARNYDAALGRFFNVDPLANSTMQIDKSPYAYTWNNPINLTDPNGMHPDWEDGTDNFGMRTIVGGGLSLGKNGFRYSYQATSDNSSTHMARYEDGSMKVISEKEYKNFIKNGIEIENQDDFAFGVFKTITNRINTYFKANAYNQALLDVVGANWEEYKSKRIRNNNAINLEDIQKKVKGFMGVFGVSSGIDFWGTIEFDEKNELKNASYKNFEFQTIIIYNANKGIIPALDSKIPYYENKPNVWTFHPGPAYFSRNKYAINFLGLSINFKSHESRQKYLNYYENLRSEYVKKFRKK